MPSRAAVESLVNRQTPIEVRSGFPKGRRTVQAPKIVDLRAQKNLSTDPRVPVWDKWAEKYHTLLNMDLTAGLWQGFQETVNSEIPDKQKERDCLDAGCGTGFVVEHLGRTLPNARIVGIDLSIPFLERAQERVGTKLGDALGRVGLGRVDLTQKYPFEDETFDLVTMNFVFQYFSAAEQQHMVAESARVLRPGGKLILSTFSEGTKFKDVIMPIFVSELKSHGSKAVATLLNIPVTKKFDAMREQGLMNNPSDEQLSGFHTQAGFSDFRIARRMMHPVKKGWSYGVYTVGTK